MATTNEPGVHVYARIAEEVSKKLGTDMDSLEANAWLTDDWSDVWLGEDDQIRRAAVIEEAREYGIEPCTPL